MSDQFRKAVANICEKLPGSECSDPWGGGHDAWKVGGKMYACIGAVAEGVSIKCADIETAEMLKEAGVAVHAPYFHKSWVRLPQTTDEAELEARIRGSYDLIFAKLSAKVRRALLDPSSEEAA
ncbi:MAG: MmcQ/YjbR family DNA-binding protein [Pseudomonadota bacterium]